MEFADRGIHAVQSAADELKYGSDQLLSGAEHDAMDLSVVRDTGMVFAVSENGKSHFRRNTQVG